MFAAAKPRIFAALHQIAFRFHGFLPIHRSNHATFFFVQTRIQRVVFGADYGHNGQVIFFRKFKISLVAARHRHNSTCAVICHNIVRHPNGHLFAVNGVNHIAPREGAVLFFVSLHAVYGCGLVSGFHHAHYICLIFCAFHQAAQNGALWC